MEIKWYGHSCFELKTSAGVRFITDPYDPPTGRTLEGLSADALTISHNHHDHNYITAVSGKPQIISGAGEYSINGVRVTGYDTWHDDAQGTLRGANTMYLFEIDGMRVLHCGDLGCVPDASIINAIKRVDVMLVPIGGVYTINGDDARAVANMLMPRVLIPMHYAAEGLPFRLEGLEPFLSHAQNCRIHRLNQSTATLMPDSLGTDRILVFSV